ncbi:MULTISPECIES: MFS transporter [Sphingobium]|jgi:predicted MFS family arabinose efflux permease|uniref:MFS transporter n=2 Tax=Sphingobium yanoikuyae TaxID=13690 RepID=A0AA42X0X9_SPHYA|nr:MULTISPECIES: MFS transporter [Sphingobium]MBS50977.1 MFS transporter [Sphingobium sp.]MCC4256829.1 MFS transporter [Sphingobium lactosutens]MDH2133757.1 MFS transporter [Sphingobium yanoikuyae]MDH2169418.1 MFS transporter [Sphingobium yanoikuyae]NBB38789.1 MFS transporter [Sphingobium yanoikuyae]|tara:strand:+ start:12274 stop:13473 length:1200 start_codon:yes stop_codon:yes gene_type:complete
MPASGKATTAPAWGAVIAMALCATILIASEFMPVSLLTPIARDLAITEGHAGQSISISGFFALVTSLFISAIIGVSDRRRVVLFFTALMVVSGMMVALAPNAPLLMAGRALLGVAIGGFWSISAAIVMRLVPEESVPKALALLNGGNAVATTLGAPIGSLLGGLIGWRGAFFCVVPLAVIALLWQWRSLPALPTEKATIRARDVFALLKHRKFAFGMVAVSLFFFGQFTLFTYLRPFLDLVTGDDAPLISGMLLALGVAGFVGTIVIGWLLKSQLYSLLITIPAIMAVIATTLVEIDGTPLNVGLLLTLWGLLATAAPVGWWTWLSKTMPHEAEAGGGLMVAIIQLAVMLGAIVGGTLFDAWGYRGPFSLAAGLLVVASLLAIVTSRIGVTPSFTEQPA